MTSPQNSSEQATDVASTPEELLLDHEYDGIREYDNPMPRWWRWIFWGSFYFSVAYFVHYQLTGNGTTVQAAYETDLAIAREAEALAVMGSETTEASLANLAADNAMMLDAAKLYVLRCASCHAAKGEGLIGPNLTDGHWIHGDATLLSIHSIIGAGVPAKGMPAWSKQLRPIELAKLAAFIGTLRGTNLPGAKAPEGRLISVR
jgi:cytochrome c oxidase cbb3-type subunit III